jgi:hypothetical protein
MFIIILIYALGIRSCYENIVRNSAEGYECERGPGTN